MPRKKVVPAEPVRVVEMTAEDMAKIQSCTETVVGEARRLAERIEAMGAIDLGAQVEALNVVRKLLHEVSPFRGEPVAVTTPQLTRFKSVNQTGTLSSHCVRLGGRVRSWMSTFPFGLIHRHAANQRLAGAPFTICHVSHSITFWKCCEPVSTFTTQSGSSVHSYTVRLMPQLMRVPHRRLNASSKAILLVVTLSVLCFLNP